MYVTPQKSYEFHVPRHPNHDGLERPMQYKLPSHPNIGRNCSLYDMCDAPPNWFGSIRRSGFCVGDPSHEFALLFWWCYHIIKVAKANYDVITYMECI